MTDDDKTLVERLKGHSEIMERDKGKVVRFIDVATCTEAADRIEAQAAEIEQLLELVTKAYAQGFGDAWAIAEDNLNQVAEYGACWDMSHAFAALRPKEGE